MLRRGVIAVLVLCAAWSARAQTAATASGGYRVAGRVVDGVSGDPVRRVTMSLLTQEEYRVTKSAVTDEEGHFAFDGVPAGKYPLTASKRGYRTSAYDQHDEYSSAIVTGEGQKTDNLVFRLEPEAVLHGVVTGEGGDAVEHAEVMLFKRATDGAPGERLESVGNADTDDTGAYEMSGLAAGEYLLAVRGTPWYAQPGARPDQGGQGQSPLDVAYPITYYDSTTDEGAAKPIPLAAGSREEANINMHAVPALRFRISVPWNPLKGPRMTLQQKIFGNVVGVNAMEIGVPGQIEMGGIAPGSYEAVIGDPPRRMSLNASQNLEIDASAGTPTETVSGSLVMAGGGQVPEIANLTLTPESAGHESLGGIASKGRFEMTGVSPGTWSLSAGSPNETLVVVATSTGGAAAAGDKVVVRERPVSVVVTLSKAQTRVKGFAVKNGKGSPGVMVVLAPKEASAYPALARRDQSDLDGSFELRNVPAGQYTVVAIEEGWKLAWQKRAAIAGYIRGGVAVTVPEQAGPVVLLKQGVAVQASGAAGGSASNGFVDAGVAR